MNRGDLSSASTLTGAVVADRVGPGTLLAGRYLVERLLGRGGMGEVYRARGTKLGEVVALKLLPAGTVDPVRLRLLLGEVRVARQITHPNVCRVHDVVEAAGLRDSEHDPRGSPARMKLGADRERVREGRGRTSMARNARGIA